MTELPEPTAADEQAKADLDTKVAADEEVVAGDLRTEEAAHAQSQADLQKLAADEAGGTATPTEAAPAVDAGGTSDAASDPTNSQPSEPGATLDSPIPGAEPVTEGQSPEGADPSTGDGSTVPSPSPSSSDDSATPAASPDPSAGDAGSSAASDSGDAQTAFVPPAGSDPAGAFADAPTPAAAAPFDPSSGGGATDPTGSNDATDQGGNTSSTEAPTQDAAATDAAPADAQQ